MGPGGQEAAPSASLVLRGAGVELRVLIHGYEDYGRAHESLGYDETDWLDAKIEVQARDPAEALVECPCALSVHDLAELEAALQRLLGRQVGSAGRTVAWEAADGELAMRFSRHDDVFTACGEIQSGSGVLEIKADFRDLPVARDALERLQASIVQAEARFPDRRTQA